MRTPSDPRLIKRIGQILRDVRTRRTDLSIPGLAEQIGCSENYWAWVELGKRCPSLTLLNQLPAAIGISKDELRQVRILRSASRLDDAEIKNDVLAWLTDTPASGAEKLAAGRAKTRAAQRDEDASA